MMQVETVGYAGWPTCYRLYNDAIELIVTGDIGPRIIRCGFIGAENEFTELETDRGQVGGERYRFYGGHRLWHAPEHDPRTLQPDNAPVAMTRHDGFIRFTPPPETLTGIQKEMDIWVSPTHPLVRVTHRLRNIGLWPVELGAWSLSMMAHNGVVLIPLPPRPLAGERTLLPVATLGLWNYTNLADPRWTWGERYIRLRQDPAMVTPQKIGLPVVQGWAAYYRAGHLFIKLFTHDPAALYPDYNCSFETFTNNVILELETLGPLTTLAPQQSVEHIEHWYLAGDVPPMDTDDAVDAVALPLVEQARRLVAEIR